jgi:hypothetical protein
MRDLKNSTQADTAPCWLTMSVCRPSGLVAGTYLILVALSSQDGFFDQATQNIKAWLLYLL